MVVEVVRITHAVAPDVGPAGILGIRPPIVALGEIIMLPAGAAGALRRCDGDRSFSQVRFGRFQDSTAVDGADVQAFTGGTKPATKCERGKAQKSTAIHGS